MLLIGIDGGGTKTDAVLLNETGRVLKRVVAGPTNPTSVRRETLEETFHTLLSGLLKDSGGLGARVDGCFAGIGGCWPQENRLVITSILNAMMPNAERTACSSDTVNALNSGIGKKDGVVAIAGTGSSVMARAGGDWHQVGGWGYLLGDEGSGYSLGRMALNAALRAHDGRGERTLLTALCEGKLGMPVAKCIPLIYQEGRTFIASFAPCLTEAAAQGDKVARELFEEAARGLSEAILAAGRRLSPTVHVVLAGSVWQPGGLMERRVKELLGGDYAFIRPKLPPVYGSAIEAACLAGFLPDDVFGAEFARTIEG